MTTVLLASIRLLNCQQAVQFYMEQGQAQQGTPVINRQDHKHAWCLMGMHDTSVTTRILQQVFKACEDY